MKKIVVLALVLGFLSTTVFTSCREKSTIEKVADDIEDAVD